MHSITDLLNILLESIFMGFGIVIPILALIRTSNLKTIEFKNLFILTAVQTVRVAGIMYFILAVVHIYKGFSSFDEYPIKSFLAYFWHNWYVQIMYLALSQLFWIKKIYFRKPLLIIVALLLLILPTTYFFLLIQSLFSDYVSISQAWAYENDYSLLKYLLNIVVFFFITITIILSGGKLKKKV